MKQKNKKRIGRDGEYFLKDKSKEKNSKGIEVFPLEGMGKSVIDNVSFKEI